MLMKLLCVSTSYLIKAQNFKNVFRQPVTSFASATAKVTYKLHQDGQCT
jgi:hypothetical protein